MGWSNKIGVWFNRIGWASPFPPFWYFRLRGREWFDQDGAVIFPTANEYAWFMGALFLSALIVAGQLGLLVRRQKHQLTPQVTARFSPGNQGCIVTTPEFRHEATTGTTYRSGNARYVRVAVESGSQATAESCTAQLVSIEKKLPGDVFKNAGLHDSIVLKWAIDRLEQIDIPYLSKKYVDIVKTDSETNSLSLVDRHPLTLARVFKDHATYRLTVIVVCGGISQSVKIDLDWNGQWDALAANEAKNGSR